jgi:hypothetical protein
MNGADRSSDMLAPDKPETSANGTKVRRSSKKNVRSCVAPVTLPFCHDL